MVPGGRRRKLFSHNKILTRLILCAPFCPSLFPITLAFNADDMNEGVAAICDQGLYTIKKKEEEDK